ncbi:hypothetical protein [Engelhardtia mirabilis]|uniref:Uncharacterized protein n=1 Tax=Engelhardtia mirabilis TaxID=2528011 RepID=A0A518BMK7_9BACT|nr:hypothetical protein Pla133_32990 [Planctomycetes bacterium Pla133]QDV02531.1 hypothetical protein Pla86_32980 [Planctomycetes bacterium Pla86]
MAQRSTRGQQFDDKFIAFVDILGFKALVAESEAGSGRPLPELIRLCALLGSSDQRKQFDEHGPTVCPEAPRLATNLDFRITQESDCVVVSCEVSPAGIANLLAHCHGVVLRLLNEGLMCRGYVTRGSIYHTDSHFIGSGFHEAVTREKKVSIFRTVADRSGTPFVEVDSRVSSYVDACGDQCVREMFSRMVHCDGELTALFPFKSLSHSFIIGDYMGHRFDAARERAANANVRALLHRVIAAVQAAVDAGNTDARRKAAHYVGALRQQLEDCDWTDRLLDRIEGQP